MTGGTEPAQVAWRDACARLASLGDEVFGSTFPSDDADRADAVAHLAQQVTCWFDWSVWHADPRRPFFQRQNDLITQWGGPNADNIYRHARVDPARQYRIRGRMNSCEEWVLAIRRGFMHQPTWGTVHEAYASSFGIGAGDEFELILGGEPVEGANWAPLPEGAVMVTFREYYYDWAPTDPAFLTIECIDGDAEEPAPRLTQPEIAARMADAVAGVEHSVRNWNSYLNEHRAESTDNVMAAPHKVTKGLAAARYAFCVWNLQPDEALVLESTVPDARYWSFQAYEMGTYELIDLAEHQSSLNHKQVTIDADGKVRVVVAHRDPGVANWIETANRVVGQFTFRFFWPNADPEFHTRVVKLDDLAAALPDATPMNPAQRAEQMAARRAHLAFRYRT
jgi:uncharacterized membrane protein